RSADGSVGPPHARVGNCQASICDNPDLTVRVFCISGHKKTPQILSLSPFLFFLSCLPFKVERFS
ncbi:MAG: hypothetical protein E6Z83_13015, partial [Pantoea sp.]|uniref:hypothetical protein n=1 Tax=Pantoea sp. TaxID=69393 RepID=UPI00290C9A88